MKQDVQSSAVPPLAIVEHGIEGSNAANHQLVRGAIHVFSGANPLMTDAINPT